MAGETSSEDGSWGWDKPSLHLLNERRVQPHPELPMLGFIQRRDVWRLFAQCMPAPQPWLQAQPFLGSPHLHRAAAPWEPVLTQARFWSPAQESGKGSPWQSSKGNSLQQPLSPSKRLLGCVP